MDTAPQIDLSTVILAWLQVIAAILGALVTLGTVFAPIFPSWKNLDSKVRPVLERLGAVVHTVEGFRFSVPFTRYIFKGKPPVNLLIIAFLLVPRVVHAEQREATTNETPAPAAKLPTIAEVAACTLSAIPGVVTDCVIGGNYKGPAVDSRVFWTTLGVGAGNSVMAIGAFLAAHYWPVSNDNKQ